MGEEGGADNTARSPAPVWAEKFLEWIPEHPIQAFTALVTLLSTIRLVAVSRFNTTTMAALLQHTNLTVIGTTLGVLLWAIPLVGIVALLVRWAMNGSKYVLFIVVPLLVIGLLSVEVVTEDGLGPEVLLVIAIGLLYTLIRQGASPNAVTCPGRLLADRFCSFSLRRPPSSGPGTSGRC